MTFRFARQTSHVAWLLLAAALGCSSQREEPSKGASAADSPAHSDHDVHTGLPTMVRPTAQVIADAKIRTAAVVKEALVSSLALPGEVASDPDHTARISTPVGGRIESVSFKEGMAVKKGDALAVVRVPELGTLRGAYTAALAKANAARSSAARQKALLEQRLAPEQAFVDASAIAEAADAEARSLGEQLTAIGAGTSTGAAFQLVLRAPLSGVVIARDAIVGQPITSDQTLGTIADLNELWFLARVFEKDLGRLRVGAQSDVQLNAYPSDAFEGNVEYVGQQIDPVARTVTARIRLQNRDGLLRIGLFGMARVAIADRAESPLRLVVPRGALIEVAGKTVVFVRHPDGDFELHEVVVGEAAPGKVEVVSGLREGEDVVVEGAFTLKSMVLKSSLAESE